MSIGCANLTLSGQLRDRRWPLGGKLPGDLVSGLRCGKQRRQASNMRRYKMRSGIIRSGSPATLLKGSKCSSGLRTLLLGAP
jgi:hypothetical protein